MKIKQKIIRGLNSNSFEDQIDIALTMGWLVHSIAVNDATNTWIAVMYQELP